MGQKPWTDEEAAMALRDSASKLEKSKIWGKHNTFLGKAENKEEQEKTEDLPKKEKGMASALWFVQQAKGVVYQHLKSSVTSEQNVLSNQSWCSEKQTLDRFLEDELQKHLQSGRVQ